MKQKNSFKTIFKHIDMKDGNTSQCWPWTGKLNAKDGRPYYAINRKRRPAYSYVLEATSGEQPNGRMVLHACDNPICCNPSHLSWGTHQDNMNDMVERDRHGLPKTVVRAIRKLLKEGRTQQSIADLYGISRESVSSFATNRSKPT